MPRKPKKFKEEKIAEEYFPVGETDLQKSIEVPVKDFKQEIKTSVEKEYKRPNRDLIEKVSKKPRRKYTRKKTTKILIE